MAPRRGGGGSDSGSGSSSSPATCDTSATYPCTSEMMFMFGNRDTALWTPDEARAQLVLACIWAAALLGLLLAVPRGGGGDGAVRKLWPLRAALGLLGGAFAFLAVRYGFVVAGSNVPVGYRFEASVVALLWRGGLTLAFWAVYARLRLPTSGGSDAGRIVSLARFWVAWVAHAALSVAYVVLDFLVSADALEGFKARDSVWLLGDRDFALTMDGAMINELKAGLNPRYVRSRMWDDEDGAQYERPRDAQIKIGVVVAALGMLLALTILASAVFSAVSRQAGKTAAARANKTFPKLSVCRGYLLITTWVAGCGR